MGISNPTVEESAASAFETIIEMLASYADQGHPPDLDELPFAPFDPDTEAESGGGQ